ncbi:hypothetical protein WJX77_003776 [Trebouxia sp. C0004]
MPGALMLHLISEVSAAAASIGFARRTGNTRLVHGSLSQLLQTFPDTMPALLDSSTDSSLHTSAAADRRTALVFGREESGLTAHELSLCTHSCSIPTGSRLPSLYLSHAVCVVLAQLYELRLSKQPKWAEDSVGGLGSHGRKRRTAGHVNAVLSRAQVTVHVRWPTFDCGAGIGMIARQECLQEEWRAQKRLSVMCACQKACCVALRVLHGLCCAMLEKLNEKDLH